jgi:hypothetical protein
MIPHSVNLSMLFVTARVQDPNPKLGLPIDIERTFTEVFNEKKPMYSPIPRPWWGHYGYSGVMPSDNLRLPAKLLMVCKGLRYFNPDFYSDRARNWIVSARFLEFLQTHGLLQGTYEQSELTVMSTTQKPIASQPYYLLRLFTNSRDLVDFERTTKLVSPVKPFTEFTPPYVYYTDLAFKPDTKVPPLFYLDDRSYFYSFFCNEEIKAAMESAKFLGFDFYTLADYAQLHIDWEQRFSLPA